MAQIIQEFRIRTRAQSATQRGRMRFILICAASVCAVLMFEPAVAYVQVGVRSFLPLRGIGSARFGSSKSRAGISSSLSASTTSQEALAASFSDAQGIGMELGAKIAECTSKGVPLPKEQKDVLGALISHSDGARGFYVSTLTDPELSDAFPADGISSCLKTAIAASPDPNAKLLAMNVAMSSAMEIAHKANGNEEFAAGSRLTRDRSKIVIKSVISDLPELGEELRYLLAAADGKVVDGEGAERVDGYKDFCVRWGYGDAEKKAISNVINEVLA